MKKTFFSKTKSKKEEENERKIIEKIRRDARREMLQRERKELVEIIRNRIGRFLLSKRLLREIKMWEKKHEKERKKSLLPKNEFGD